MKNRKKQMGLILLLLVVSTSAFAQVEGGITEEKTTLWQMILQGGLGDDSIGINVNSYGLFYRTKHISAEGKGTFTPGLTS
ncbi:MAG: hypothetical protein ACJZ86_04785 [Pontiellaceae bacterium]